MVTVSTEDVPGLADFLEQRKWSGLDTYDEWHAGTYVVNPRRPANHELIALTLGAFLAPLLTPTEYNMALPLPIGVPKEDCRVADLAVYHETLHSKSIEFLSAGVALVVEILTPEERSLAHLDFYRTWRVSEYLEIDPEDATMTLLVFDGAFWVEATASEVVGFRVVQPEGKPQYLAGASGEVFSLY